LDLNNISSLDYYHYHKALQKGNVIMSRSATSTLPQLLNDLGILEQEPISPQGLFLAKKLRIAHDRHIEECNDNTAAGLGHYEDVYGLAMIKRLSEKLQQCLDVEDKYGHKLESFQRLQYERYHEIYRRHYPSMELEDLHTYTQREKWRDLFRCRLKENQKLDEEMRKLGPKAEHMSKMRGDATEALRCLTYLTREEPCEEGYDALERWVFWDSDWESAGERSPITRAIVIRDLENVGFRLPRDMANLELKFEQAVSSALDTWDGLESDSNATTAEDEGGQAKERNPQTPWPFWISRT
jgi:hypothetical protein